MGFKGGINPEVFGRAERKHRADMCSYCGLPLSRGFAPKEHVAPKTSGGVYECRPCNIRRTAYRKYIKRLNFLKDMGLA